MDMVTSLNASVIEISTKVDEVMALANLLEKHAEKINNSLSATDTKTEEILNEFEIFVEETNERLLEVTAATNQSVQDRNRASTLGLLNY